MFEFCSLSSSSNGNCFFIKTENTKVLVDAGISCKKVEESLESINIDSSTLDGILITHEHSDHIKGLSRLSKKYDIPVYSTLETFNNIKNLNIDKKNINNISLENTFYIGDLKIKPFSIPHDAVNPCGFNIFYNNRKLSIATDIGHINNTILKNLEESTTLVLEANYDTEMLKFCKYPAFLKRRVAGPIGHLSNVEAGKVISHLVKSGLQTAVLGHLSKESNFPELAHATVVSELFSKNISENSINLSVANKDYPSKLINI